MTILMHMIANTVIVLCTSFKWPTQTGEEEILSEINQFIQVKGDAVSPNQR